MDCAPILRGVTGSASREVRIIVDGFNGIFGTVPLNVVGDVFSNVFAFQGFQPSCFNAHFMTSARRLVMIKFTTPYNVVITGSPNASRRADLRITNYNGLFFPHLDTWLSICRPNFDAQFKKKGKPSASLDKAASRVCLFELFYIVNRGAVTRRVRYCCYNTR